MTTRDPAAELAAREDPSERALQLALRDAGIGYYGALIRPAIRALAKHGYVLRAALAAPGDEALRTAPEEAIEANEGEAFALDVERSVIPASLVEQIIEGTIGLSKSAAAIPAGDPADWTALANDIRIVDGNHDLGAGELAERLVERGWRKAAGAALAPPEIPHDRHE